MLLLSDPLLNPPWSGHTTRFLCLLNKMFSRLILSNTLLSPPWKLEHENVVYYFIFEHLCDQIGERPIMSNIFYILCDTSFLAPKEVCLMQIDSDKTIMVTFKHDDKFQEGSECAFQVCEDRFEVTAVFVLSSCVPVPMHATQF